MRFRAGSERTDRARQSMWAAGRAALHQYGRGLGLPAVVRPPAPCIHKFMTAIALGHVQLGPGHVQPCRSHSHYKLDLCRPAPDVRGPLRPFSCSEVAWMVKTENGTGKWDLYSVDNVDIPPLWEVRLQPLSTGIRHAISLVKSQNRTFPMFPSLSQSANLGIAET